MLSKPKIDI